MNTRMITRQITEATAATVSLSLSLPPLNYSGNERREGLDDSPPGSWLKKRSQF